MADITAADLSEYANAHGDPAEFVQQCTDTAISLVERYCEGVEVPAHVLRSAQLEAGLKLLARRQAPNGTFQDGTGAAIYAPRDVMITAATLLAPFLPMRGL